MNLEDRIADYVKRFYRRSGRTEFPTVRRIAKSLRLRQSRVLGIIEGTDRFEVNVAWGCGGGVVKLPSAEWTVETYDSR